MHVLGLNIDLNQIFQFIFTLIAISIVILQLVKTTASNYFSVDANFEEEQEDTTIVLNKKMVNAVADTGDGSNVCAVCASIGKKQCSGCKNVRYCSTACQSKHWRDGHKQKCQELKLSKKEKASVCDSKSSIKHPLLKQVLFPYEDFINLFNWEDEGYSPCGLLNCGNSCYANVVLQCLSCTRPLIAYLLKIGHDRKCRRNDWCFLCELEAYVKRTRQNARPFSPINILSRLPNIGGNLGYGKQEDAHEFMRFAIDTMQSVCLDEYGGEKALHPTSQETTLIQYIFGGHLKSQVKCSKCNKISYRHENMMDLTVEIHGDAESLEECLDQFTAEEWLDGENMYKCDGCNDYVKACKRLAVHHAPNILTIALKRFQSGRFGKLNKRVSFPETLDLGPYMSEPGNGTDIYRLYAVVVHIDMLNASYFGHYICYTKDFNGNWYRIDDCKVTNADLDEVLAQGAYMLLYKRTSVRPSSVKFEEAPEEKKQMVNEVGEAQPCLQAKVVSVTVTSTLSDVSSAADKEQQGDVVVEKSQPSLPLPVEPIVVEGSTNSPKENDSACMDSDDLPQDNLNYVREDVAAATDLSSAADLQGQEIDVEDNNQPCLPRPFEPVMVEVSDVSLSTMRPSSREDDSVCMNLDGLLDMNPVYPKEDLAATADLPGISKSSLLHTDPDCADGVNYMSTREEQMDNGLDNPESSSSGMELDDCGHKYSGVVGKASSVEISYGGLTPIPLSRASPSAGVHNLNSQESGTSSDDHTFVNGNTITGVRESISNGLPLGDRFPSESDAHKLSDVFSTFPFSDLHPAVLERNSSTFHDVSDPMLGQVETLEYADGIPTAQITTGNILKSVHKPCSNGKQGPLLCEFLSEDTECESPNRNGVVLVQSDEVGPCKVSSNCNGFSRADAPADVVLDSNGTLHSNGQLAPSLLSKESEKWSNKAEPGDDCGSVRSQVVDIVYVEHASSVLTSAPSTDTSLPTATYDLRFSPTGHELDVVHTGENGNNCLKSVGSLSGPTANGLNATSSFVPFIMSSSDTEMVDSETDHVNSYQSREGQNPVFGPVICSTEKIEAFFTNLNSGKSTPRRLAQGSAGSLGKQKTPKFKKRSDAPGNVNRGNKSTNHASGHQNDGQATKHDRGRSNDALLESTCEKMDEDERIDTSLGEGDEPRQSRCNGSGDCGNVSSQAAEIALPVNNGSTSAPSSDTSSPTSAYDLGLHLKNHKFNVLHRGENGNSCTESVGSLPGPIANGVNPASSLVSFVTSTSDTEMIDSETDLQNNRQFTNHDRNHKNEDLLEATCCIENQREKMEEILVEAGEPQQSHCNRNGDYSKVTKKKTVYKNQTSGTLYDNDNDIEYLRHGFLNKPERNTPMKKEQGFW